MVHECPRSITVPSVSTLCKGNTWPAPYMLSPSSGRPMLAMCTRIWCVRPTGADSRTLLYHVVPTCPLCPPKRHLWAQVTRCAHHGGHQLHGVCQRSTDTEVANGHRLLGSSAQKEDQPLDHTPIYAIYAIESPNKK